MWRAKFLSGVTIYLKFSHSYKFILLLFIYSYFLTNEIQMRLTKVRQLSVSVCVRGGAAWPPPPENTIHPNALGKMIQGTPYQRMQEQLHARGLHDPWMRAHIWYFDKSHRAHSTIGTVSSLVIHQ